MKFILKNSYKSLRPFKSPELPPLVIITGKNGTGKSQLLQLIKGKNTGQTEFVQIDAGFEPAMNRIQSEGLEKSGGIVVSHSNWRSSVENRIHTYRSISPKIRALYYYLADNNLVEQALKNAENRPFSEDREYKKLSLEAYAEFRSHEPRPRALDTIQEGQLLRHILLSRPFVQALRLAQVVAQELRADRVMLKDSDFYNAPIPEELLDTNDLFSSQMEMIFYNYAKRRDRNRRSFFDQKEDGKANNSISDAEFIKSFPPPWELINEILKRHHMEFTVDGIGREDFNQDASFEFKVNKTSLGDSISFGDLSSGEKIIFGLIIKLFTSEYYSKSLKLPELLILDEPDAHLHPEMSQLLLEVLEETFVKKYGIKVLFTTHSPSTIALANEEYIYQLQNGTNTSISKVSKDDALKLLTGFIPTLSIDYRNHRQVFVESPTDVNYYQTLWDKHSQNKRLPRKLYFIANAMGKGNSTLVMNVVSSIRKSGNTTSYGIIDWDLENNSSDVIQVHGENERYSLENFILDPIYLTCLFMENNAHGILEQIGKDKNYNQYTLGQESQTYLQSVADNFFSQIEAKFPTLKADSARTGVHYLNGTTLQFPTWYLKTKGHSVDEKIRETFGMISGKFKNEGELQASLTQIMAKSYPFVPLSSVNLLETLSTA